ncbi:MAG TPA: hypothetical protein VNI02_20260, partial [Blastocatellia bacterium]|nr:hypothetical protein [Blastocatellia bacterium]
MSHLSLPRIHFKGDFSVNPGTGNNEDVMQPPTTVGGDVKLNINSELHALLFSKDLRRYMESVGPLHSLWNYYGDNECYVNATVTSVELSGTKGGLARRLTQATEDSLIGAQVLLNDAVIVDVNGQGARGPQIFADEFVIQRGESQGYGLLCEGQPTTSYLRWYNTGRNQSPALGGFPGSSAVFQFSLPRKYTDPASRKEKELFLYRDEKSPALLALLDSLKDDKVKGLTVRLCFYFARPSFRTELNNSERELEMARLYAEGQKLENPAVGRMVGTIGPWYEGELASVTMGRLLIGREFVQRFGPATAVVDEARKVIALDFANTFPEQDETLEKADWGQVTLVVKDGDTEHKIDHVFYDAHTYETTSGVVEVSYASDVAGKLKDGRLALRSAKLDALILSETPYMIDSDDKCAYMELGETLQFEIHALYLGRPDVDRVTMLDLAYEKDISTAEAVAIEVLMQIGYEVRPARPVVEVQGPQSLLIAPGRPASFTLKATATGSALIYCRADSSQPPDFRYDFYVNVRVLPDDAALVPAPDEQVAFKRVYEEVLRYYQFMHPAMNLVFDLSNEDHWTPRWAKRVLERIDPAVKDRYKYMPRSRDMSRGRRALLERWCKQVIATK